mmetsp:Transcript_44037/g.99138  ORF Transcript_44037/g.99138 Transcript_44037/m.99138 type:complete len:316 (-) Transcript_44037:45-992(-)
MVSVLQPLLALQRLIGPRLHPSVSDVVWAHESPMLVVCAARSLHSLVNQDDLREGQVLDSRVEPQAFGSILGHQVSWIQIHSKESDIGVVQQGEALTLLLLDLSINCSKCRQVSTLFGVKRAFPVLAPAGHKHRHVLPKVRAECSAQLRHHPPGTHRQPLCGVDHQQDHVGIPRFFSEEFGALVPLLRVVVSAFCVPQARRVHQRNHPPLKGSSEPSARLLGRGNSYRLLGVGRIEPVLPEEEVPCVGLTAAGGANHHDLLGLLRCLLQRASQRRRGRPPRSNLGQAQDGPALLPIQEPARGRGHSGQRSGPPHD